MFKKELERGAQMLRQFYFHGVWPTSKQVHEAYEAVIKELPPDALGRELQAFQPFLSSPGKEIRQLAESISQKLRLLMYP